LARAIRCRRTAIDCACHFQNDKWSFGATMMEVRRELLAHLLGAYTNIHGDSCIAQVSNATTGDLFIGVYDADNHS
jgi:hypothetical protein